MHKIFQEDVNQKDPRLAAVRLRLDNRAIFPALPCWLLPFTGCLKEGLPQDTS